MLKNIVLVLFSLFIFNCSETDSMSVKSEPSVLISAEFISKNEYKIVCYGYPKPELTGVARRASAERAARMNAHYFVRQRFDSSVNPGVHGRVEKIVTNNDYAIIHYIIKRKSLKSRLLK